MIWLLLAITIVGLVYGVIIGLFIWLGHGLLAAHLKSEAVRVNENQLPELHAVFLKACQKLGLTNIPKLYVLQAGGALNAFATKFAGRNFVVVYSDFLDAFGPASPEIEFILGHELGHLKSNHIGKRVLLAPGIFLPLIGPAYLRACEASCDRYGAFVAANLDAAMRAMLTLGGGKQHGQTLDASAFASQHWDERGFFVSWHELSSPYPTLSQRVQNLLALGDTRFDVKTERNPFAYLFALVTPGGRLGNAGGNMLIFVVIIGLLAAMAIPAFNKVRHMSELKACLNNERQIAAAYDQYTLENGHPPASLSELAGPGKLLPQLPHCPDGGEYFIDPNAPSGQNVSCTRHGSMEDIRNTAATLTGQQR